VRRTLPTILLLGPNGQVGWELRRTLAPLGRLVTAARAGADETLDLLRPGEARALLERLRPDLVVNAAAYTAVDAAESEEGAARRVNAEAVAELGEAARKLDCPVVHYSTDYVFSGKGDRPWREEDPTEPLNVYGRTKLEGEKALAASGADHLVLRLAWVYGMRGSNFLLTMGKLLREREAVRVVSDQRGAPTWSRFIAEATAQILAQCRAGGGFAFGDRRGLYHLTAGGETSWHQFASLLADRWRSACRVEAVSTADYPTPARRPAYSVLDNDRLEKAFGIRLPHWREGLDLCLETPGGAA